MKTCSGYIFCFSSLIAFSAFGVPVWEIAPPSLARMINESNTILEGRILCEGETVYCRISSVFKGEYSIGNKVKIQQGIGHEILELEFKKFVTNLYENEVQVIILGKSSDMDLLILPWHIYSIWPRSESYYPYFKKIEDVRSYIVNILHYYDTAANDQNSILQVLTTQTGNGNALYVLGFLDAYDNMINDSDIKKAIYSNVVCTLILGDNFDDIVVEHFFDVCPVFPAALSSKYLTTVLELKTGKTFERAVAELMSTVRRHDLLKQLRKQPVAEIKTAIADDVRKMEIISARQAIKLLHSNNKEVQQSARKALLLILSINTQPKFGTFEAEANFWENAIKERENQ